MTSCSWKKEQEFGLMQMEQLLAVEDICWFGRKLTENGRYYVTPGFLPRRIKKPKYNNGYNPLPAVVGVLKQRVIALTVGNHLNTYR